MAEESTTPIEIFLSYAHQDEDLERKLEAHLSTLRNQRIISIWSNREISAGSEVRKEIEEHLNSASIILLLISPDYVASDELYSFEMARAVERHKAGEARVMPVLLRPVDFSGAPFEQIPILPTNGRAVTRWTDRDSAFLEITREVQSAVNEIRRGQIIPAQTPASSQESTTSTSSRSSRKPSATQVSPSSQVGTVTQSPQPSQENSAVSAQQVAQSGATTQGNSATEQAQEPAQSNAASQGNGVAQAQQPSQSGATTQGNSVAGQAQQATQSNAASQGNGAGQVQQAAQSNATPQTPPAAADNVSPPPQTPPILKEGAPDARSAVNDKAVRKLSEDKLKFETWVRALANFIVSQETTTPLTIGVDGPWGTGKSSFMYMLKDTLEPSRGFLRNLREVILPWFGWFVLFILTLPLWLVAKWLVGIGGRIKDGRLKWVQEIGFRLSYDPEIQTDLIRKQLPWHERIAAWIAEKHCPRQPKRYPTVWFNAWKYDQEEQLWAALALAVLEQIKKKYNIFQRVWFWFRLTWKRSSPLNAIFYFALKALPLVLGLIAWRFDVALKLAAGVYKGNLDQFTSFIPLSQAVLGIGAGVAAFLQIASIYKDPFQIPVKRVFDKPDYKEKVGFIGSFEDDFSAIVSLVTQPSLGWKSRKLVIFIDDLDRCKLPKAVDVIEGINLFLDSEQCVFVIGMDTTAVIASIETKYENLFKQIQKERAGIVSAGRLFLDKIIQISIHVPPATEEGIENLVKGIIKSGIRSWQALQAPGSADSEAAEPAGRTDPQTTSASGTGGAAVNTAAQTTQANSAPATGTRTGSLPSSQAEQAKKINRASYSHKEVRDAILFGTGLLELNPRQVKRFINLLRLYIYVANEQEMFEEEQQVGLTMNRLAAWIAWSMRWGDLVRYLSQESQLSESELVNYLLRIATSLEKSGCWSKYVPGASGKMPDVPPQIELTKFAQDLALQQKGTTLHWSGFPWNLWLRDQHFLTCIKELEGFWQQSQSSKVNWLQTMLRMAKITAETRIVPPDGNALASNGAASLVSPPDNNASASNGAAGIVTS